MDDGIWTAGIGDSNAVLDFEGLHVPEIEQAAAAAAAVAMVIHAFAMVVVANAIFAPIGERPMPG